MKELDKELLFDIEALLYNRKMRTQDRIHVNGRIYDRWKEEYIAHMDFIEKMIKRNRELMENNK
jgi:hypothetical protein